MNKNLSLNDFITGIANKSLEDPQKYIREGRNGPYGHRETLIRTLAHWLFIYCYCYQKTGNIRFKNQIEIHLERMWSKEFLPNDHGNFICRKDLISDRVNGVIGAAWIFEALAYADTVLKTSENSEKAQNIYLNHKFDDKWGLWHILDEEGRKGNLDPTFNHQLWFAAATAQINQIKKNPTLDKHIGTFIERITENLTLYDSGLIYHGIKHVSKSLRNKRLKNPAKVSISAARRLYRFLAKEKEQDTIYEKSFGYHVFNLYAFVILKTYYPHHSFWETDKARKVFDFLHDEELLKNIATNKYAYPYNPPGFEVPFVLSKCPNFDPDYALTFLQKQIDLTYDPDTHMFSKNNPDPVILTARLYEACRIEEKQMEKFIIRI